MSLEKSARFDLLDGLRGLTAIAVMVFHFTQHNSLHWLSGAWVAVDLFFILSGFVVAHSYGAKLLGGMHFQQFLLIRFIRLGPLYFLGWLIGLIAAVLSMRAAELGVITPWQLGTAAALGAAWLPYPNNLIWPFGSGMISSSIFPLNDPAWSLFFEVFVNAVFFCYVYRFRKLSSVSLLAIAGTIFLVCTLFFNQMNPGWGTYNFIFGFPRVVAEFFAGALVYQMGLHKKPPRPMLTLLVGGATLLLFFKGGKVSIANSLSFVPLTVVLASAVKVEMHSLKHVCKVLGSLSYPLYIIHYPMYRLLWQVPIFRTLTPLTQTVLVSGLCILLALLLAVVDERVRKAMTARLV